MATAALRQAFAGMFLAQIVLAALLAAAILLLGDAGGSSSILGPVLVVLGIVQCGLGLILPSLIARNGSKGSVLSATLLAAVLLATPGWFLALALITGQGTLPLLALALTVSSAYALGFVLSGRLAARSVRAAAAAENLD